MFDFVEWVNSLGLSKKCRSINRDFSDGVLMSEVVHHFYPKLVDLHNYEQGLKIDTKIYNWNTLNQKIFKKLGFPLDVNTINGLANSHQGYVEKILTDFKNYTENKVIPLESVRQPTKTPKKKKEVPPEPMNDADRECLVEKIYESAKQKAIIAMLEAKYQKLKELMMIKDAKLMKSLEKSN